MPLWITVLSLFFVLRCAASDPQCTLSPYEWQQLCRLNNNTIGGAILLCRTPWCELMQAEPDGLVQSANRPWLLSARQYVCGALNRQRQQWQTPDAINQSLLFLGDSLETACANMSQWRLSAQLSDATTALYGFNHRTDLQCPKSSATPPVDTFFYTRAPDILVLRAQRDTNATARTVSALGSAYSVNLTLLVLLILVIFAATLMALKMVADRSANRHWIWCLNQGAVDDDGDEVDQEMTRISHIEEHVLSSSSEDDLSPING